MTSSSLDQAAMFIIREVEHDPVSATLASQSKVFGSELNQRMANFSTEFMGLHGQLEASRWAPLNGVMIDAYQRCMGGNIAAGTSEIQRNIIAWAGLGLPRFN